MAEEVPGTAALNHGSAWLSSLSCTSAGNCSGGGLYSGVHEGHAYVVGEKHGVWESAIRVGGFAALNAGGGDGLDSVSCTSADDCTATGTYFDSSGHGQVFVVSETGGIWGKAAKVPGLAALNQGGGASGDVSCASPGNCGLVGSYTDSSFNTQAFADTETNGTWGKPEEIRGTAALNQGGDASAGSVQCPSAGNCTAVGGYSDLFGNAQDEVFVVTETNGIWGKAERVPGLAKLDPNGTATFTHLSCPSAGNCSAGGFYRTVKAQEAFIVTETNGTWGTAENVPGLAALNTDGGAATLSMSCSSAGNCSAGGFYASGRCSGGCMGYSEPLWPFVITETNGTWGTAEKLPGIQALNKGKRAELTSVSCASAGDCSAGGFYADGSSEYCCLQTFVDTETNGTWGTAEEIPGTAALNHGDTEVNAISCGAPGDCSAGGDYTDSSGHYQAFVVRESKS